jgi:hypothetical protein
MRCFGASARWWRQPARNPSCTLTAVHTLCFSAVYLSPPPPSLPVPRSRRILSLRCARHRVCAHVSAISTTAIAANHCCLRRRLHYHPNRCCRCHIWATDGAAAGAVDAHGRSDVSGPASVFYQCADVARAYAMHSQGPSCLAASRSDTNRLAPHRVARPLAARRSVGCALVVIVSRPRRFRRLPHAHHHCPPRPIGSPATSYAPHASPSSPSRHLAIAPPPLSPLTSTPPQPNVARSLLRCHRPLLVPPCSSHFRGGRVFIN